MLFVLSQFFFFCDVHQYHEYIETGRGDGGEGGGGLWYVDCIGGTGTGTGQDNRGFKRGSTAALLEHMEIPYFLYC